MVSLRGGGACHRRSRDRYRSCHPGQGIALDLLDSALHAPQAGFGDEDFYPAIEQKAAVLAVRIARNHPLPDGNKRLAWQSLTVFLALNGRNLVAGLEDAVTFMLGVAAGEVDEPTAEAWIRDRLEEA